MKKIITLVIVLLILIGGYSLLRWYSQPPEFCPPVEFMVDQWKDENIDKFSFVYEGGKEVVVEEKDSDWFVGDFYADNSKIEQLFTSLNDSAITSRVSTNSQNHSHFQVGDKGIKLTMAKGDEIVQEIIFGKSAGGTSVYVRLFDQDEVYVLSGFNRYNLSNDSQDWLDRKIARFNHEDIRRVQFTQGYVNWDLSRLSGKWQIQTNQWESQDVKENKIDTILSSIGGFQGDKLTKAEQREELTDSKPIMATIKIELGTADEFSGQTEWNLYDPYEEDKLLLFRDDEDYGFYITKQTFENIFSDYATVLAKLTAEDPEPATLPDGPVDMPDPVFKME